MKRSALRIIDQGQGGTGHSCLVSQHWSGWDWQAEHSLMKSSKSVFMRGQYSPSLAYCRHPSIPMCYLWICLTFLFLEMKLLPAIRLGMLVHCLLLVRFSAHSKVLTHGCTEKYFWPLAWVLQCDASKFQNNIERFHWPQSDHLHQTKQFLFEVWQRSKIDSRNNCWNNQSQEFIGPIWRHKLEDTSGRTMPMVHNYDFVLRVNL